MAQSTQGGPPVRLRRAPGRPTHRPALLSPAGGAQMILQPADSCFLFPSRPSASYCDPVPRFHVEYHKVARSLIHAAIPDIHPSHSLHPHTQTRRSHDHANPPHIHEAVLYSLLVDMRYQSALVLGTLAAGSAASSGHGHAKFHKRQ